MRLRWRFGLVAIVAAAVVGGFMPHGVLSGAETTATEMVQIAQSPASMPLNCMDVTCGKGSPAPAAPTPTVAAGRRVGRDRPRGQRDRDHPSSPSPGRGAARRNPRPAVPPASVLLTRTCAFGRARRPHAGVVAASRFISRGRSQRPPERSNPFLIESSERVHIPLARTKYRRRNVQIQRRADSIGPEPYEEHIEPAPDGNAHAGPPG